jgi:hypothetical protein
VAVAALFALGACGALLFVAGVLHIPINAAVAALAALISLAATTSIFLWRRETSHSSGGEAPVLRWTLKWRGASLAATVVTLIPLSIIVLTAFIHPLDDYDGRAFWMLKAKGIAHDHAIDGPFFRLAEADAPRNDYPLLMPLDAAAVMLIDGSLDDRAPRFLYIAVFVAFVFMIAEELGGWWAALLAWIPMFTVATEGGALSAYADIALAAFAGGAFFELVRGKNPWRFGAWVAFVLLTKREGFPLALILLVAGAFVFKRASMIVAPLVAFIALAVWRSRLPAGDEENFFALLPALPQKLHRLPPAILAFARHFVSPMWGLFWIAALIALVARRRELALPAFIIAAAVAADLLAYTVTTWVQIDLINSSADRLLMHVVAPALYAMSRFTLKPP